MTLENKLNITDQMELAQAEERISKQKARQMFELTINRSGCLDSRETVQEEPYATELAAKLGQGVKEDGICGALLALAAFAKTQGLPPAMLFWRDFAAEILNRICHTPENAAFIDEIEPLTKTQAAVYRLSLPPMTGAEYVTEATFIDIWNGFSAYLGQAVAKAGSLAVFLESRAPRWRQVGRVCFHLAENKGDGEYPFAFLATYASGLGKADKLRFLPISQALTEYAGTKNKKALLHLLVLVSNAAKQSELIKDLLESGEIYHPYPLTDGEAYTFLQEIPLYEESGLLVCMPDWWRKRPRVQARVNLGAKVPGRFTADTMLDFNVNAAIGDEELSAEELKALLAAGSGLRFVKGQWVEVDAAKLNQVLTHWQQVQAQAGDGISLVEGLRLLAGAALNMKGGKENETVHEWSFIALAAGFKELIETLRAPANARAVSPGKLLQATLRPYQQQGLAWLNFLAEVGLGACLADDMGLGKTIQVIALLLIRQKQKKSSTQPALLVVPDSLLGNWQSEIERFAPSLQCLYLHRAMMDDKSFASMPDDQQAKFKDADVVLTTYAMFSRQPYLSDYQWNLAVIDEAQAIKNPGSKQTINIKKIKARARIALTGTPVENRLGDLWSLFDFINPGLLGSAKVFQHFVNNLETRRRDQYKPLRALTAPYILRRLKTDKSIISDLPDKTEVTAYCRLTKKQAVLYEQNVKDLAAALAQEAEGLQRKGMVLSSLMRFKQICNHPSQLLGDGLFTPGDSGKFERLKEICEEIAARQDKVLIFS